LALFVEGLAVHSLILRVLEDRFDRLGVEAVG
jgi:hypothetical protein